jgi:hypothetical protein
MFYFAQRVAVAIGLGAFAAAGVFVGLGDLLDGVRTLTLAVVVTVLCDT